MELLNKKGFPKLFLVKNLITFIESEGNDTQTSEQARIRKYSPQGKFLLNGDGKQMIPSLGAIGRQSHG